MIEKELEQQEMLRTAMNPEKRQKVRELKDCLQRADLRKVRKIMESGELPVEVVNNVLRTELQGVFFEVGPGAVLEAEKRLKIPEQVIQDAALGAMRELLLTYEYNDSYLANAAAIGEEIELPADKAWELIKESLIYYFHDEETVGADWAFEIADAFKVSPEHLLEAGKEGILWTLQDGFLEDAILIKEKCKIKDTDLNPEQLSLAIKKGIRRLLVFFKLDKAFALATSEEFKVPFEDVQTSIKEILIIALKNAQEYYFSYDYVMKIKERFQLSDEILTEIERISGKKINREMDEELK